MSLSLSSLPLIKPGHRAWPLDGGVLPLFAPDPITIRRQG